MVLGRPPQGMWQMLVIYRGLHCPICKNYLGQLNDMKADFDRMDVQIVAVSTDPEEKARKFAVDAGLDFEVAYGLSLDQARDLGLYISTPLSDTETDEPFAEPGLFFIRPDGGLHFAEISSAPFCRPDLQLSRWGWVLSSIRSTPLAALADHLPAEYSTEIHKFALKPCECMYSYFTCPDRHPELALYRNAIR